MLKRHPLFLSSVTSIFFILTIPPFDLKWIAFVAFVPIFLTFSEKRSFKVDFLQGSLTGAPYFVYVFHWITNYNSWIYLGTLLSYIPFVGVWVALSKLFVHKLKRVAWAQVLIPPLVWVALCFVYDITSLRSVGAQALFYQDSLAWMQSTKFLGTEGPLFLILFLNAALAYLIQKRNKKGVIALTTAVAFCGANFIYGRSAMRETFETNHSVALVQHNMTVDKEWWVKNHKAILRQYQEMGREAAKENPDLIIFPSYSLPLDAYRNPEFFERLAKEIKTHILVSSYVPKEANKRISEVGQYEMTLLYSPTEGLVQYDRSVQAPPFRKIHQVLAEETEVLETPIGKLGVLLCFEDAVAGKAKEEVRRGAEVIAAISNPGHFVHTFMPEYHLYQDQLRAIESGKFVMRVSARGYSAIIDPKGRILQQSDVDEAVILRGRVG